MYYMYQFANQKHIKITEIKCLRRSQINKNSCKLIIAKTYYNTLTERPSNYTITSHNINLIKASKAAAAVGPPETTAAPLRTWRSYQCGCFHQPGVARQRRLGVVILGPDVQEMVEPVRAAHHGTGDVVRIRGLRIPPPVSPCARIRFVVSGDRGSPMVDMHREVGPESNDVSDVHRVRAQYIIYLNKEKNKSY